MFPEQPIELSLGLEVQRQQIFFQKWRLILDKPWMRRGGILQSLSGPFQLTCP